MVTFHTVRINIQGLIVANLLSDSNKKTFLKQTFMWLKVVVIAYLTISPLPSLKWRFWNLSDNSFPRFSFLRCKLMCPDWRIYFGKAFVIRSTRLQEIEVFLVRCMEEAPWLTLTSGHVNSTSFVCLTVWAFCTNFPCFEYFRSFLSALKNIDKLSHASGESK